MFLEISQNSQENTCARISDLQLETLALAFYCEFCEIYQNTFSTEHLWTIASKFITELLIFRSSRSQMFFKIIVLKNFAILEPLSNNKPSFTEHLQWLLLNFCGSKYFFAAEYGIYR